MKILLDTNFLLYCAKYNLFFQLEEKYPNAKFIILNEVIFELEKMGKKFKAKTTDKIAATTALDYLKLKREKQNLEIIHKKGNDVDKIIFEEAKKIKERDFFVATMDEALAEKLKKAKINLLRIRQKKKIVEE